MHGECVAGGVLRQALDNEPMHFWTSGPTVEQPAGWRIGRHALGLLALCTMWACSPELDWREARTEAAGLRASFPCRPDKQVRLMPLAGAPVQLALQVCKAAGWTFAVSHTDVTNPARVGPALIALREALRANVAASTLGTASASWQVPGMTPQPAGGRWSFEGRLPDGAKLQVETAVFSRGTHVVQATLLGPVADEAGAKRFSEGAAQPFFDGLRFLD